MSSIYYANYFLPAKFVSIENCISTIPTNWWDEYESLDAFYKELRVRFGFDKIYIGDSDSKLEDMSNLMSEFLDDTQINPSQISYIIDTEHQDFFLNEKVNITQYLVKKFSLKNACAFSLQQQCGASCLALGVASNLVSQKGDFIVILSNNTCISSRLGYGFLWGDGASILIVSKEPTKYQVVDYASLSSGSASYSNYTKEGENSLSAAQHIHIMGINFIETFLARNNLNINNIYMIIPQSLGTPIFVEIYSKVLGISTAKIFLSNIPNGGHQGNVDIVRNFKDFTNTHSVSNGAYILFYALSLSYIGDVTFNVVLVKYSANAK